MAHTILDGEAHKANVLRVAITDIYDELSLERLRVETKCRIIPEQHSELEIRQIIRRQSKQDSDTILNNLNNQVLKKNTWESEPIINLVDSLIESAIKEKATDIHLEPSNNGLRIRFRIDGMLNEYKTLPAFVAESILIRLKILAAVDITERRLPHDGSFTFESSYEKVNIRLSTLPVINGEQSTEKCVLRILKSSDDGITLDDLKFDKSILKELRKIFNTPQGLFLVTGPTGSGKTTTLYAGLREIISKKINVTTIEDPVEYKLHGANQVQVNNKYGFTFALALRSILRQDPDVILIGEIRDSETAQIALRAAQTGHLVLATLHTNSAKSAKTRLIDLGIPPLVLEESLLGVIAQRLLRKLAIKKDNSCKQKYQGRQAIIEFLKPDETYVNGTLKEHALELLKQKITDKEEILRVLGN